jgi:hypothetical protein
MVFFFHPSIERTFLPAARVSLSLSLSLSAPLPPPYVHSHALTQTLLQVLDLGLTLVCLIMSAAFFIQHLEVGLAAAWRLFYIIDL